LHSGLQSVPIMSMASQACVGLPSSSLFYF
jgi:hypothetical protein